MNFSDVFKSSFLESFSAISWLDMVIAMAASFILGLFVLWVYKKTFAGVMYSNGFAVTLVGLSMVTTLVILAVTSNVVLSLGMVGALSIVRFRAAIKEPLEIVFLFWSLVVGIVVGAGLIPLAVFGSLLIGLMLYLICNHKSKDQAYILMLRCSGTEAEEASESSLKEECRKYQLKAKTIRPEGLELSYEIRLKSAADTAFVNRLQAMGGVESAVLVSYNGEFMSSGE